MSLLTEQEIKDLLIPLFTRQDQASIHWPDIFEEVALIESAVIEKIKAQGLVAGFGGLRLTPKGTNEFWGWTIGDSADVLISGMNLYRLPEGD